MSRTVTVVEMWQEGRRAVYTVDELRLLYPERKNRPRKCRSHAMKILRKRQLLASYL